MNNCPSHVDTVYYVFKYKLDFHNKKEAIEHYLKIGKQKGYFPNREMEVFYCKTMNFDVQYYKRKYCISGDNNTVKRHWKLYGSKEGHYVNHCDEMGEHTPFTCKCRIKNKTTDKRYSEDCDKFEVTDTDSVEDSSHHNDQDSLSDQDRYVFSDKFDAKLPSNIIKIYNNKESIPECYNSFNTKEKCRSKLNTKIEKKDSATVLVSVSDSDNLREAVKNVLDSEFYANKNIDSQEKHCPEYHCNKSKFVSYDVEHCESSNIRAKKNSITGHAKSMFEHSLVHSSDQSITSSKSSDCECSTRTVETIRSHISDPTEPSKEIKKFENAIFDSKSLAGRYRSKMNRFSVNTEQEKNIDRSEKIDKPKLDSNNVNVLLTESNKNRALSFAAIKVEKECAVQDSCDDTHESNKITPLIDIDDKVLLQLNIVNDDSFEADFIDNGYKIVNHASESKCIYKQSDNMTMQKSESRENGESFKDNQDIRSDVHSSHASNTSSKCTCAKCVKDKHPEKSDRCDAENVDNHMKEHNFTSIYTDLKQKLGTYVKFPEMKNNNDYISRPVLCDQSKEQEQELEQILSRDKIKLQQIQEKLMKIPDVCSNDLTDRYIFDKHMEIVCQNMSNIKIYLNMCHIYLDTYTTILKQAYQCLTDICNSCNNYIMYNTARVKLCNMLKEAENISNTSYCNDLPIFYTRHSTKKSPTSIKFPLLISTSESINKFLIQNIGEENVYFRIHLMKINLRHLKLEKYCLPSLNRCEQITSNTSPIPPSNCPVGKTPTRDMYLKEDLLKCWDINYHLKQFENALYKIIMTREILCNYSNLIEIKEELVLKIKIANVKSA